MANLDGTQNTISDAVDRLLSARDTIRANFVQLGLSDTNADLPALAMASFEVLTGFNNKADKGEGLWGFTEISSGADLNDYTACGFYKYSYDEPTFSIQNSPAGAAFTMQVMNACGYGDHDAIAGKALKYRLQKLTTWQGDEYVRQAYTDNSGNVTFGAWERTLYADSALPALGISTGSWTPTLSGISSYSYQRGSYLKIGDIAIVSFSLWGIMAGSATERIKISGCPLIPADGGYSGGGSLSGYYTDEDSIFTNWAVSEDGSFYAYGQRPGSGAKWESSNIFQKTGGECGGGGTLMFKTSS